MKIGHVAIWSKDIEKLKKLYVDYFDGSAGDNRMILKICCYCTTCQK